MIMRIELEKDAGERKVFYGTFNQFAIAKHRSNKTTRTLLLTDIKDIEGHPVTDHVWMLSSRNFDDAKLKKGDQVKFQATIVNYIKNRVDKAGTFSMDYTLEQPALIQKIGMGVSR